jgi:hypothetical protein
MEFAIIATLRARWAFDTPERRASISSKRAERSPDVLRVIGVTGRFFAFFMSLPFQELKKSLLLLTLVLLQHEPLPHISA